MDKIAEIDVILEREYEQEFLEEDRIELEEKIDESFPKEKDSSPKNDTELTPFTEEEYKKMLVEIFHIEDEYELLEILDYYSTIKVYSIKNYRRITRQELIRAVLTLQEQRKNNEQEKY